MCVDCISALANSLMAVAATVGAVAAFIGLTTWKKQSLWHADAELAKRALLSIYAFRDSLHSVRNPFFTPSETEIAAKDSEEITAGEKYSAGVINTYEKRWEKHSETSRELETILLEADAVWCEKLRELSAPIAVLEQELRKFIYLHINAHHLGHSDSAITYQKIYNEKRYILYDFPDKPDGFRIDLGVAIKPVEDYLKTKMGRK